MSLVRDISRWIHRIVRDAGARGVVLGVSGGVDSAVTAALAHRALPGQVLGAIVPCESAPDDTQEARLFCQDLGIESIELDLTEPYRHLVAVLPHASRVVTANLKPRLRMIALYHLAGARRYLVCGTSNRTELLLGYSTKFGDGAADFLPLGGLLKRQVYDLARQLHIPESIIARPPSAGLWPGQTDEGELGMTYERIDQAIAALDRGAPHEADPHILARVRQIIAASEHKRTLPPVFSTSTG